MQTGKFAEGTFCWADVTTRDAAASKAFYGNLFGWDADDLPAGEGRTYTLLSLNSFAVAGLIQDNRPEIPPHWDLYIAVADTDSAIEKAKGLGGEVVAGPMDAMNAGRLAVIRDPAGAVFCLWQPRGHPGFGVVAEPGAYCWAELNTNDTDRAASFYAGLMDWGSRASEMGPATYTMFQRGEQPVGGMMAIQPEWGPVPPNWLVYFQVESCDASAARAVELGAKTLVPGTDVPGVGRFSILRDPQGAVFAIVD